MECLGYFPLKRSYLNKDTKMVREGALQGSRGEKYPRQSVQPVQRLSGGSTSVSPNANPEGPQAGPDGEGRRGWDRSERSQAQIL